MSTTITITKNINEDYKTVVLVCFDKASGKYRSLNLGKRMIAPQEYDTPEQIIDVFQKLKDSGRIKDYDVIKGSR